MVLPQEGAILECKQNNQETASLRAPRIIDRSGRDRRRADVDDDVETPGPRRRCTPQRTPAAATRATVASPPREGAPARADRRCIFGVSSDHAVSIALPDLRGKVDKRDTAV